MGALTKSWSYASYERGQERNLLLADETFRDKSSSWSDVSVNLDEKGKRIEANEERMAIPEPSKARKIVTMVACLYLHMSAFGMFVALGVVYVEFIGYFDSPRSMAALVQSVYNGFAFGGGIIFSKILTTYDTGVVIMIASLVSTASFCASAFAPGIEVVIVLVGGVAGLAVSNGLLGAFVVTSWMFRNNRKLALAFLTIGSTVGQIMLPYVTTALIDTYLWQGTLIVLGSMVYLNCIPCGLVIHFAKPYFQKGDKQKKDNNKLFDLSCFKDLGFVVFLVAYIVFSATVPVEQWFVVDLSIGKGFSASQGATLLSLNGIFGFTGRVIGTLILRFAPGTKQELHMAVAVFTWGIAHIIISQSPVYWGMVLGMILRGLSAGLSVAFLPGLQMDIRGLEKYPQTMAISNCIGGLSGILGGFLGGLSYDITGSYDLIFFIASGGAAFYTIAMIGLFSIFKKRKQHKDYEIL